MKNNSTSILLKGIALLILDMITCMLVFSVWALINISLFPWSFTAILVSLALVNIVVLISGKCIELFGTAMTASLLMSTVLYYLFVMIFTGLNYITISPKWYIVIFLITTLVYAFIVLGLYSSGVNKSKDMIKHGIEQGKVQNVKLQLIEIKKNIMSTINFMTKENHAKMVEAFDSMNERLNASTPFGRTNKTVILDYEDQIHAKLTSINEDILLLNASNDETGKSITEALMDVKALIIYREKLMS
ncbi:hypothetical protein GH808_13015 [Acetobacterium fimetarium]|uniref:Uncharacterized protein n=1 Tax=Acetobacterium fimetarium TaxID=52691 RepID=A0ABR6WXH7_9FIRM|nr:hypothetical protein [Acetobacterium fimetarium]MBC3805337.1 hypothetical protein [Acetobacterium fimetarium]